MWSESLVRRNCEVVQMEREWGVSLADLRLEPGRRRAWSETDGEGTALRIHLPSLAPLWLRRDGRVTERGAWTERIPQLEEFNLHKLHTSTILPIVTMVIGMGLFVEWYNLPYVISLDANFAKSPNVHTLGQWPHKHWYFHEFLPIWILRYPPSGLTSIPINATWMFLVTLLGLVLVKTRNKVIIHAHPGPRACSLLLPDLHLSRLWRNPFSFKSRRSTGLPLHRFLALGIYTTI